MPTEAELNITQGSDYLLNLVITDDFGTVIDLTNYSVSGYVKNRYGDENLLFDLAPTITDAAAGGVNIFLKPSETALYPVGKFHYSIEVGKGDIVGFKVIKGYINVIPEVNR